MQFQPHIGGLIDGKKETGCLPLHPQLRSGDKIRDAGKNRGQGRGRALRGDTEETSTQEAPEAAQALPLRTRAPAARQRNPQEEQIVRRSPQLSGCRLLSTLRPVCRGHHHQPRGIPDRLLRKQLLGYGQVPGHVRVREYADRPGWHGGGRIPPVRRLLLRRHHPPDVRQDHGQDGSPRPRNRKPAQDKGDRELLQAFRGQGDPPGVLPAGYRAD